MTSLDSVIVLLLLLLILVISLNVYLIREFYKELKHLVESKEQLMQVSKEISDIFDRRVVPVGTKDGKEVSEIEKRNTIYKKRSMFSIDLKKLFSILFNNK